MFGLGNIWNRLISGSPVPTTYQSGNPMPFIDPRIQFFEVNGETLWQDVYTSKELIAAYQVCSPLSSIINKKSFNYSGGELFVKRSSTDKNVRGKFKEWEQLLNRPNPLQSGKQFFNQMYTYAAINGWTLVMKVYPFGFKDRPAKLWNIPFWLLEFENLGYRKFTDDPKELLQDIYFCHNGERTKLDPDNLILICDETGVYDDRTWLPKSRVRLLQYPVSTWISAVEGEVTMIQKRGAMGIISPDGADAVGSTAFKDTDKHQIQMEFANYGLTRNQYQQIITNKQIKYQSITIPVRDMMLAESQRGAIKQIADGYNYPFQLLAESDQSTYNNVASFDKKLYQDAIMPEAESLDEQLGNGLSPDIYIVHDYSGVPALQKTEEEKAKGESAMMDVYKKKYDLGLITRNEILKAQDQPEVQLPEMNMYSFQMTTASDDNTNTDPEEQTS